MEAEVKYKRKIVAFIDILGFSQLVKQSSRDNSLLQKIYKVLAHFVEERNKNNEIDKRYENNMWQYSTQSDCIVISYSFYQNSGSFFNIVTDIYYLIYELSFLGFILRGGITIGDLVHEKDVVFGPALVDAVCLEEKIAHYPRIIISEKDFKKGIAEGYLHSPKDDEEYIRKRLKKDSDGFWYVDFFEQYSEFDTIYDFNEYMINWKKIIESNLKEWEKDANIYSKYCWLATKFNNAIKRFTLPIEKIKF